MEMKPADPGVLATDERPTSAQALPRSGSSPVGQRARTWNRHGKPPPEPAMRDAGVRAGERAAAFDRLLAKVRAIERGPGGRAACDPVWERRTPPWHFGVPDLDARLGRDGLAAAAVHEIKPLATCGSGDRAAPAPGEPPGWACGLSAALCFALALAGFRQRSLGCANADVLWCWPSALARELGHPYAPGLAGLGLDPARLLLVQPDKPAEALWALEEALRSPGLAAVVGILDEVELTPGRRLALAAASHATPCLLVTAAGTPPAAATATRWRIGRAPSTAHPLARHLGETLPGAARYRVLLERCRSSGRNGIVPPMASPLVLEWLHASHRFALPSASAGRATGEARARRHGR